MGVIASVPDSDLYPIYVGLKWANIIAWSYAIFVFWPFIKNGDSPFVPTAPEKLQALFGSAGLLQSDGGLLSDDPAVAAQHLVDLGSGDGAIVRAATRVGGFGRASGYEINPGLVRLSEARSLGRDNEIFHQQSLWDAPLSDADVVVVYCLPQYLGDLGRKLGEELRDDAIVVSVEG